MIGHAWLREVVSLVLMAKQHLLLTVISVADGSEISESPIIINCAEFKDYYTIYTTIDSVVVRVH